MSPVQARQAQLQAQRRRRVIRTSTPQIVTAPVKGWNTRDPFEAMDPADAITLDNWYPDFAGVTTRNGSVAYANLSASSPVQTLASFVSGASAKLLAACAGKISTVASGVGTPLATGFGSDIWQTANFNRHQFWVNGTDPAQIYDGAALTAAGFTGVSTATLSGVGVFHNRLFFWTGIDPSFWYGTVNGITGALSQFDLSMVSLTGGNLVAVEVLSYDGGTGISAYTCFFMSSGEVLMYSGTDPSNPSNWALVGRYLIAPPVSKRALARYGGDIYLANADDHQQFSQLLAALKVGDTPPRTKVSGAARSAYLAGAALPGWQALYYPSGRRIIFNIPNPGGTFSQHVYNTSTQAWCRFTNQNAYCFGIFEDALYYGSANGIIAQADVVSSGDLGASIPTIAQQAWQLFGTPLKKRIAAVRPVVQGAGPAYFTFGLSYDYQTDIAFSILDATIAPSATALIWGSGTWGAPSVWGSTATGGLTDPRWRIAAGEGGAVGLSMLSNTIVPLTWIRTDFLIEPGSAL